MELLTVSILIGIIDSYATFRSGIASSTAKTGVKKNAKVLDIFTS
jgi:hypothetical protein